jgi:peptidoglycan/LPS O-acetylase OafA/YrhL
VSQRTLPRSPGIDLLRGISILLVVVHHLGLRLPLHKTDAAQWLPVFLLKGFIYNGYEAVFLFFVISGFLITRHVVERDASLAAIDWRAFYLRRVARIMPCLLALLAVLLACHVAGVPNYVFDKPGQSPAGATLSALTFTLNVYEGRNGWLPGGWDVLWSLSVEEVFYLAFPLVCLTLGRTRWLVPALVVLALSVPFTRAAITDNEIWSEKAYLPGMGAIAAGVLAALARTRWGVPPMRVRRVLAVSGVVALVAIMFSGGWVWRLIHEQYLLVLIAAAACLVLASPEGGTGMRGTGWLQAMGRASYEIYLTHMFVVFALFDLFLFGGRALDVVPLLFVATIICSAVLGDLVARYYSEPMNALLRRRWRRDASLNSVVAGAAA